MKRQISFISALALAASAFSSLTFTAAAKEMPYAPEGYIAHYSFDDTDEENEKLSVIKPGSWKGVDPKSGIDAEANPVYSNDAKYESSLDLSDGSYGVMLDEKLPKDSSYTISFWGYITEAVTENTAAVMFDANTYNDDNSVSEESWHRVVPYGGNSKYKQEYVFQYRADSATQIVWSGHKNEQISGAWHLFTTVFDTAAESSSVKLYLDGADVTASNATAFAPDLARESDIYLGVNPWSFWDKTFKGYIDDLYIYTSVLSPSEIAKMYAGTVTHGIEDVIDAIHIPTTAYGNISMPSEIAGGTIKWTSSDDAVISDTDVELNTDISKKYDTYSVIPAGVVTRGAEDKKITLTADISYEGESEQREYEVTVKAKPEKTTKQMAADGDFGAYLYLYFRGDANTKAMQQVYGATSLDGLNWTNLNNAEPILTSSMGTGGLRDHFLIRSPEGDRFYLLCTDLDASGGSWQQYAENGSKYIMVWESSDLVHWSDQRMVKLSTDDMGCTWAPETIYDENTGEYVIYWSSHDKSDGHKKVYWARTRDFYSMSEPQLFVSKEKGSPNAKSESYIDSTMIEDDGRFYRITKYEDTSPTQVFMEVSDAPLGDFTEVSSNLDTNDFLGVEGPAIFKFNDRDEWCLMLDGYNGPNSGVGFFPSTITDLAGGQFTRVKSGFKMPTGPKHGVVLPITMDEYNAVTEAYPTDAFEEKYADTAELYSLYTFNDTAASGARTAAADRSGNGHDAKLMGSAAYVYDGEKDSKVLYTNGTSGTYLEFELPKNEDGTVSEYYTVSMDIKNLTEGNYFNFYAGDGSSNPNGINYFGYKMAKDILLSAKDGSTEKKTTLTGKGVQGEWAHVDFVISGGVGTIYVNGVNAGRLDGYYMKAANASVGRLSFSGWSPDAYANCYYENVAIYNNALSETGIKSLAAIDDPEDNKDEKELELEITNEKGVDIQDGMIGLFFEDINYAADGGLYAEMIENRSFESLKSDGKGGTSYDGGYGWSAYPSGGELALMSSGGLNENNTHYLRFTSSAAGGGFKNQAYEGVYVEAGKEYKVSMFAKSGTYSGAVRAAVYKDGTCVGSTTVTESLSGDWTKYEATLTPDASARHADFVIEMDGAGSADFDMVSCFPSDAVLGIFRRDLAEKLKAVNPGFLRFPGGCVIEGYNLANRYNWKDSIGAVEERKQNWNRWSTHLSSGSVDNGYKHYNQTYGLGYYEYFLLCEYLGAKALPVINVGMACQYQSNELVDINSADFEAYIQDALDLIEFANGDISTPYGAIRAKMGHSEPFDLEIMGIGNEQWQTNTNNWFTRYERFEAAIHEKYPNMKLVGTAGPGVQDSGYNQAWSWIREKAKTNPNFVSVVDEHYYRDPNWFYDNINFYDDYPRDVKVFAGEYASRWRNQANDPGANVWEAALSEAAYLTMVERNADVVYMASYAPLFARLGYTQWSPDMIWFDDAESYGSPTYYVQKLYSNNMGDYTLKTTLSQLSRKPSVYENASYDEETGDIIVKIANSGAAAQTLPIALKEGISVTGKASIEKITGGISDVNSIANPMNVSPERTVISGVGDGYELELEPYSFTVLRIETKEGSIKDNTNEPEVVDSKYQVMGYTTGGDGINGSLHYAISDDKGETFNPVNYGNGVLYAPADYEENTYEGVTKYLGSPYMFRTADGGFGVIAVRHTQNSDTDSRDGSVMIYTSKDLMNFEFEGYLSLSALPIRFPKCKYDGGKYTISWSDASGNRYEADTEDFKTVTGKRMSEDLYAEPETDIAGAQPVNVIGVSEAEYAALKNKLTEVTNTEISVDTGKVTISGESELSSLPKAKAGYSDGSEAYLPVKWDTSGIDFAKGGTYTISGEVSPKSYPSAMIRDKADPCVMKYKGKYYFIATVDDGKQHDLVIRAADTLDGLAAAADRTIYSSGNNLVWAPELHEFGGKVYIFFATGSAWNRVQSHIMTLTGDDLLSASSWSEPVRVTKQNGGNLANDGERITLDMTCFEIGGKYYAAWSDRVVSQNASADILIAGISPENAKLLTEPVRISKPDYGWERSSTFVVEGPFVIEHDGRLFMTISGNATNSTYSIGLMELVNKAEPLNPESWKKQGYPLLSTANNAAEPGPGHNSFVKDENGDDVLVFHWGSSGAHRTTSMRTVHWASDGTPILNMDTSHAAAEGKRNVSVTVDVVPDRFTVTDAAYTGSEVNFTVRNGAGKAARAYIAEYSCGVLVQIAVRDITPEADDESFTVDFTAKSENSSIKLYVWDENQSSLSIPQIIR